MPASGSSFCTAATSTSFVKAVLALVAGTAATIASAQDAWTVPPANSVLVESDDVPLGSPADPTYPRSGEVAPLADGGFSVGDNTFVDEPDTRFEGPPTAMANTDGPAYPSMAFEPMGCGADGCVGQCASCSGGCADDCCPPDDAWCGLHRKNGVCWVGRADALLLFRDAPPDRPLVESGIGGLPVLNANGMDSPAAAGPRFSLFRFNTCNGTGIEATYLRAANWRSQRPLPVQGSPHALAPPGIYGNSNTQNFDTGNANLGAALQSFELNRHWCKGEHIRFLAGFRWVEWQENFSLSDTFTGPPAIQDYYATDCINSLYGGQIGLDAWLLTLPWMRVDSVIKAGAYYNNAVQDSLYQSNATGSVLTQSVAVNETPLNCAFVGELGLTGVVPVTHWLDLRVGYFGMWLSGIAQPTQQLSGQVLTAPAGGTDPAVGTINANGSTIVQGVSLGLEGRW